MNNRHTQPPRWAHRILSWYCRPELQEDLEGDLQEYYQRNVKAKGITRARFIYVIDVLKFFRSYTIRKPSLFNFLINWVLLSNYIRTSGRSMARSKLFTAINIVGLAVSLSIGLVVITFVTELYSYDDFHVNKKHIYKIYNVWNGFEHRDMRLSSTTLKAGKLIRENIDDIDEVAMLRNGFGGDAIIGNNTFPTSGYWANESVLKVFTFPLLFGDRATALKEPYSIVLTEKTSNRLFGTSDAVGKIIRFDTTDFTVTGIMKDLPMQSTLRFEVLISLASAEAMKIDPNLYSWNQVFSGYIYLLLPENANVPNIQTALDRISEVQNRDLKDSNVRLYLHSLHESWTGDRFENHIGPAVPPVLIWIVEGFALVIILSACFNYTNLSIARSLKRAREVGIRRVVGAFRGNIIFQFVTESVFVSLLALVIAIPLFVILRGQFHSLNPHLSDLASLSVTPAVALYFLVMAIGVGIVAGLLPSLFFARINAIQVLKSSTGIKLFRHVNLRKSLIVVQYTFSLIFISTVLIGYTQYKGFVSMDLGFNTKNIINLRLQGNDADRLRKELLEIPSVTGISQSSMVTSLGSIHGTTMKYPHSNDSAMVWLNVVDEKYLPLHEHKFAAGRGLRALAEGAKESEIVVNEQTLKRFDIGKGNPQQALGEIVTVDRQPLTIVGVLKDFHYGTTENKIEPVMLRYAAKPNGHLNIQIIPGDLPETMRRIENVWKKIDTVHQIDAAFYDDQIQRAYEQFAVMLKVIGFIAFLAICISTMGLFGMVIFTSETRLKEVSIRKVLGANASILVMLLSSSFLSMLGVAIIIAVPSTWLFFQQVVLVKFAYHSPIGLIELLSGPAIIMTLSFLMIGAQTLKVARTNPAQILKNE